MDPFIRTAAGMTHELFHMGWLFVKANIVKVVICLVIITAIVFITYVGLTIKTSGA